MEFEPVLLAGLGKEDLDVAFIVVDGDGHAILCAPLFDKRLFILEDAHGEIFPIHSGTASVIRVAEAAGVISEGFVRVGTRFDGDEAAVDGGRCLQELRADWGSGFGRGGEKCELDFIVSRGVQRIQIESELKKALTCTRRSRFRWVSHSHSG